MQHLATFALLCIAGAAGTLCRFGLGSLVQTCAGKLSAKAALFPWGTLAVNAVGCLLFGIIAPQIDTRLNLSPQARLVLLTGFLGAFTTFSTFAFETTELLHTRAWLLAGSNLLAQNVLGIACVFAGMALVRSSP